LFKHKKINKTRRRIISWTIAYAHDQNGNRTAGDESVLIAAAHNDQQVRVLMDNGNQQYITEAQAEMTAVY